jgi:hypothetical protein
MYKDLESCPNCDEPQYRQDLQGISVPRKVPIFEPFTLVLQSTSSIRLMLVNCLHYLCYVFQFNFFNVTRLVVVLIFYTFQYHLIIC